MEGVGREARRGVKKFLTEQKMSEKQIERINGEKMN